MNKRSYTEITEEQFEEALEETPLEFEKKDYPWSGEIIYDAESPEGTFILRVYSSIDKRLGRSRDKGSDAIRTVVLHAATERPVLKEKRTNRIKTWKKNLKKKINKLAKKQSEVQICEQCGNIMVIRENSSGDKFLGCTGYPDCKNTKSL